MYIHTRTRFSLVYSYIFLSIVSFSSFYGFFFLGFLFFFIETLHIVLVGGNLVSNPNQVLSSLELAAWGAGLILKVLLNPTSGRDASHPCLISTWLKEGCTIVSFDWAQRFESERGRWGFPLKPQKVPFCGRKLSLEPQSGIVLFGINGTGHRPNPQGFAQSHIGKRRLPPLPYKHLA